MGLLHDVGRFVMFKEAPNALRAIDEGDWETPEALVAEERSVCGITHGELGAAACEKWRLPEQISYVVEHHHDSLNGERRGPVGWLIALLQLADLAMFPSTMPGTPGLEAADDVALEAALAPAIPSFIELTTGELRDLSVVASADAEATLSSLGLGG
mgnify:CR=1 FL=1